MGGAAIVFGWNVWPFLILAAIASHATLGFHRMAWGRRWLDLKTEILSRQQVLWQQKRESSSSDGNRSPDTPASGN